MELFKKDKLFIKKELGKLNNNSLSTHDKLLGKKEKLNIKRPLSNNEEKTYNKYKISINHK